MDDKFKELLGEEGQTIEKFKKGTYINKDDFKSLMDNHFEKMSIEIKERRMGLKEESMIVKITIKRT